MNINGKVPWFSAANFLMLVALLAGFVVWWTNREKESNREQAAYDLVNNTQTMLIAEHEKRFTQMQDQINEVAKTQKEMQPKLDELLIKFRVMVELVDGNKSKPELHR